MKILNKVLLAAVVALLAVDTCRASKAGAQPLDFLFLDADARAVALGGAYSALANDANAMQYNPAGLGFIKQHEATFMHNSYFEGSNHEYVGVSLMQGLGLNLNYVKYGDLSRTTYSNPNSTLGNFGASDTEFGVGYGRKLPMFEPLSVGAGLKYVRESIDNQSLNGVALDLGAMYQCPVVKGFTASLALQNIGPDVKFQKTGYNTEREHLPLNVRVGAAYQFDFMGLANTAALDLSKARNLDTVVGVGLETVVVKMLALRLGFSSRNRADTGISGGVGVKYDNYGIDYAVVPFGDLGTTHRISASVRWGGEAQHTAMKSGARSASK